MKIHIKMSAAGGENTAANSSFKNLKIILRQIA
jgi:hypothetical protein